MSSRRLVSVSKLLALMLRHKPAEFGLALDAEGFVPLVDVVQAVRARIPGVTRADIEAVVDTIEQDKRRFTIVEDEIRANYGHSLLERIAQAAAEPPALLYHGTHAAALDAIRAAGLRPMRRQYVHLTPNRELAMRVGARHGKPVLLVVDAAAAHSAGIAFYRANEHFWLADAVPARFVDAAGSDAPHARGQTTG